MRREIGKKAHGSDLHGTRRLLMGAIRSQRLRKFRAYREVIVCVALSERQSPSNNRGTTGARLGSQRQKSIAPPLGPSSDLPFYQSDYFSSNGRK
jgi:hypothetical protein